MLCVSRERVTLIGSRLSVQREKIRALDLLLWRPAFFRDALREMVASSQKKILLNLGEVSYIDSSGIGELVSGFTTVTNQGGQLKLLNLTKRVKDLLQITKLYTVFDVHEDEAHAIRSF